MRMGTAEGPVSLKGQKTVASRDGGDYKLESLELKLSSTGHRYEPSSFLVYGHPARGIYHRNVKNNCCLVASGILLLKAMHQRIG